MKRASLRAVGLAAATLATLGAPLARGAASATVLAPAGAAGADSVDLVVASTTDVHGRVRGWDYFAGRADGAHSLAAAAGIVDSLRTANPGRVVLVDAGDLLQGNPLTYVAARVAPDTAAHPVPAAMNALRYDAAAIGNHEFNYGLPVLERAIAQARFPFLAANAYRPDGSRAFRAWTMVERAGLRVAIVGATTPGSLVWDRDNLAGRLVLRDVVAEVRRAVAEARGARADVVVTVVHSGLDEPSSYDTVATKLPSENVAARIAREVPGIDLLVFGHSHKQLADTTIGGTLVMQPKNYATSVGVAHLALVRRDGRWTAVAKHGTLITTAGHAEVPTVLAATESAHRRAVAYATSTVGTTSVAWRSDSARVADTPTMDLVAEVMRRTAKADLAATAAFSLDAGFDAGPITVAEIARLYPYENTLRAVRITGAQLRGFLEHSARYYRQWTPGDTGDPVDPQVPGFNFDMVQGAEYVLDLSKPIGQRVTSLAVRGRPVRDDDTFTMAVNNYRQTGGGGFAMLAGAPVVYDQGLEIRQLLIDEVKRRGTVRPEDYFVRNWRLEPAAAATRAYAAMTAAFQRGEAFGVGPSARRDTAQATGGQPSGLAPTQAAPGQGATASGATQPPRRPSPATARPNDARPWRVVKEPGLSRDGKRPRTLRIIATNDFHGALEPRPDAGGVQRGGADPLAAAIVRARAECAPPACVSVWLDGGDEFQGTPASNLAYGRPVVDVFRAMDLSASALGNHEFDWSVDTLRARIRQAPYAILGANVRYADGSRVSWLRDDTLIVRGGLRIGVVGLATPETPTTTRAINVKGLRFDPMAPVVDARARALRARGADVVIVTAHSGAFCDRPAGGADSAALVCRGEIVDMARALTEKVDAVVSGHTHSLVNTFVNGIPIVQARSSARSLGVVDLTLDASEPARIEVRDVVAGPGVTPPPAVDAIVRRAVAAVASRVNRRVAEVADAMPRRGEQYPLGNLIADAQRWAGRGDVAVMNNGGIRADLRAGTATYGSLFEIQPFGNVLYKVTVRGRDLRTYLENVVRRAEPRAHVSGVLVTFDTTRAAGQRIVSATFADGRPIADDALYSIVMNDFLVTGGDGLGLAGRAASVTALNIVDLDALIGYMAQAPQPVRAPAEQRLRAVGTVGAGGAR